MGSNRNGCSNDIICCDDQPEVDQINKGPFRQFVRIKEDSNRSSIDEQIILDRLQELRDRNGRNAVIMSANSVDRARVEADMQAAVESYQHQLGEKQKLIRNLECLIQEYEDNLQNKYVLEGQPQGVRALVAQLSKLQGDHAETKRLLLTVQSNTEIYKLETENKLRVLRLRVQDLDEENMVLRQKAVCCDVSSSLIKTLERDQANVQHDINKTRSHFNDVAEQKQKVENTINDLRIRIQLLEEELTNIRDKEVKMADEKADECSKAKEQLANLRLEYEKVQIQLERTGTRGNCAEEELQRKEGLLKQIRAERQSLQDQVHLLEQRNDDMGRELESLNEFNEDLNKRLSELNTAHNNTKQQLKDAVEKLEKSSEMRIVLKAENEQLCEKVKHKNAELQSAKTLLRTTTNNLSKEFEQKLLNAEKLATGRQRNILNTVQVKVAPCLQLLIQDLSVLKQDCQENNKNFGICIQESCQKILKKIKETNESNIRKYKTEMALRKRYHNELVELKGNIRVFCRVRPILPQEDSPAAAVTGSAKVVDFDQDDDGVIHICSKTRIQSFDLDRVFGPEASQEEVFAEVKSLVISCIDGFHVCIFAYGQTGSGKTYTMQGPAEDKGINHRALVQLFQETRERSQEWSYKITVSMVEIYNETIRDLLSTDACAKMEVKMNCDGSLYLPNLTEQTVCSVTDVNKIFEAGSYNRATAATTMNEHSSRSHALLCVTVTGKSTTTQATTIGKLNLVDLAGSERVAKSGADGARLKEAQNINKSLAALGDVIAALRSKQPHVPYRNSKLTYLLQDSLGGKSKTVMMVQVSPTEKNAAESLCTLNFARRVRSVELGVAVALMRTSSSATDLQVAAACTGDGNSATSRASPAIRAVLSKDFPSSPTPPKKPSLSSRRSSFKKI